MNDKPSIFKSDQLTCQNHIENIPCLYTFNVLTFLQYLFEFHNRTQLLLSKYRLKRESTTQRKRSVFNNLKKNKNFFVSVILNKSTQKKNITCHQQERERPKSPSNNQSAIDQEMTKIIAINVQEIMRSVYIFHHSQSNFFSNDDQHYVQ